MCAGYPRRAPRRPELLVPPRRARDNLGLMRRPQAGFTMIEVMISIVITAIAVMGIIGLYKVETRAQGVSRHTTEAAVLAEDKIEKLRTQGAAVTIPSTVETTLDAQGKTCAGCPFKRTYSEDATPVTYADIVVKIDWTDDGVAHALTIRARRNK
jgi:prepilin-type N-terminal cleavage/methylation domain-containing protein